MGVVHGTVELLDILGTYHLGPMVTVYPPRSANAARATRRAGSCAATHTAATTTLSLRTQLAVAAVAMVGLLLLLTRPASAWQSAAPEASTEPVSSTCAARRLRATKSSSSIGWLGRAATRATASHWAVHNRSVCVPEALAEASVRGQCALPQRSAVIGCLQLPAGECRAAVCVPGFSVPAPFRRGQRAPGCVTRSHADADVKHVMCASGCLLLTLDADAVAVQIPREAARACAGAWHAVLTEERPGELWFDGLSARASRSVAVEEKGMRLFLLDQPETGMPRGWKRKQPRIKS